jgi:hypothetical protein
VGSTANSQTSRNDSGILNKSAARDHSATVYRSGQNVICDAEPSPLRAHFDDAFSCILKPSHSRGFLPNPGPRKFANFCILTRCFQHVEVGILALYCPKRESCTPAPPALNKISKGDKFPCRSSSLLPLRCIVSVELQSPVAPTGNFSSSSQSCYVFAQLPPPSGPKRNQPPKRPRRPPLSDPGPRP